MQKKNEASASLLQADSYLNQEHMTCLNYEFKGMG